MLKPYKKFLTAAVMAVAMLGASGCSTSQTSTSSLAAEVDLIQEVKSASSQLIANTKGLKLGAPVLAATFADIDDLQQSSTFGRTLSEQFTTSLAANGVPVIEVKMRDSLFVKGAYR